MYYRELTAVDFAHDVQVRGGRYEPWPSAEGHPQVLENGCAAESAKWICDIDQGQAYPRGGHDKIREIHDDPRNPRHPTFSPTMQLKSRTGQAGVMLYPCPMAWYFDQEGLMCQHVTCAGMYTLDAGMGAGLAAPRGGRYAHFGATSARERFYRMSVDRPGFIGVITSYLRLVRSYYWIHYGGTRAQHAIALDLYGNRIGDPARGVGNFASGSSLVKFALEWFASLVDQEHANYEFYMWRVLSARMQLSDGVSI